MRTILIRPPILDAGSGIVAGWLERPNVLIIEPGQRFWSVFSEQVLKAQVRGAMVTDAALASLALEHGARVCTNDRDFLRFSNLNLFDPLVQR